MQTVLITGLSGFAGVHAALAFLGEEWKVHGTVRTQEKKDKVLNLLSLKEWVDKKRIEVFIVPELVGGDFTQSLQGVSAVVHCASPWHLSGKTWKDYREPAVDGTVRLIKQAAEVPTVKHFTFISSFAAEGDAVKPWTEQKGVKYTESDWLPYDEQFCVQVEKEKNPNGPGIWYAMSKKIAEQEAYSTHKAIGAKFTISSILPAMIFGPSLNYSSNKGIPEQADMSTKTQYHALVSGHRQPIQETVFTGWSDVRNVAQALYEVVVRNKSGRFNVVDGSYDFQILANVARKAKPEYANYIPRGDPSSPTPTELCGTYEISNAKAEKELGIKKIPLEKTVVDTIEWFVTLGAVHK